MSKPVTPKSRPQVRNSSFTKPQHVRAPGPSRNSSPESVGSNTTVHNYHLDDAKNKRQIPKDKAVTSKPSVSFSARAQNTINGSLPKPRNFIQQNRNWPLSMNSRVSNAPTRRAEKPRNT